MNRLAGGRVFCSHTGTPYRSFRSAFEPAVRKAGLEDCAFHDLRHTFASRLVMAGADLPIEPTRVEHKSHHGHDSPYRDAAVLAHIVDFLYLELGR